MGYNLKGISSYNEGLSDLAWEHIIKYLNPNDSNDIEVPIVAVLFLHLKKLKKLGIKK